MQYIAMSDASYLLWQVRFRMQTLKETLFDRINAVLSIVQSETPPPAISGRWMGVYRKFVSFFGNSESSTTEAGEVQHKLRELHEEIKGQLDAEVSAPLWELRCYNMQSWSMRYCFQILF